MFKQTIELMVLQTLRHFRACLQFQIGFGLESGLGLHFRVRA